MERHIYIYIYIYSFFLKQRAIAEYKNKGYVPASLTNCHKQHQFAREIICEVVASICMYHLSYNYYYRCGWRPRHHNICVMPITWSMHQWIATNVLAYKRAYRITCAECLCGSHRAPSQLIIESAYVGVKFAVGACVYAYSIVSHIRHAINCYMYIWWHPSMPCDRVNCPHASATNHERSWSSARIMCQY